MVELALRRRGIRDERGLGAMARVPRERFLRPELRAGAHTDGALPIGRGQTMSRPFLVAAISRLPELTAGSGARRRDGIRLPGGGARGARREVVTIAGMPERTERARAALGAAGDGQVIALEGERLVGGTGVGALRRDRGRRGRARASARPRRSARRGWTARPPSGNAPCAGARLGRANRARLSGAEVHPVPLRAAPRRGRLRR